MLPKLVLLLGCAALLFQACGQDPLPKPRAMLSLQYPDKDPAIHRSGCPYIFEYNALAEIRHKDGCAIDLDYQDMKASIFITYKPVEGNLRQLLTDAQKLSYEHVVKADNITEQPFVNPDDSVYGMLYEVRGNAASQAQFYLTDSTSHFITGSLYFHARPNYDSIYPAAAYLQGDIRGIMESLRWKN